jgi:CubicO group peptidase (beta-lactamase class C family)
MMSFGEQWMGWIQLNARMKGHRFIILLAIIIINSSPCFSQSVAEEKLDSFMARAMSDWHVMGAAVAIVKKDSLLLAKGYGYRDYSAKLPVTGQTIFPIASCSKTFVSGLMGIAASEKMISLDKPVHQYFPAFRLYNDSLTNQATIEDLLSHRTGVAGHDWAWTFNTNFPEEEYLKRLAHLEPFAPLRTQFQYNSFMYFALSALSEKLFNKNWNDLLNEKFFQPLEMNSSYSSFKAIADKSNMSLTYKYKDSFRLAETFQMDDLLGGGSLNSTATDLAHWLQAWVNGGMYKNKSILPHDYIKKATGSYIIVGDGLPYQYPDEQFENMGLGWFLSSYRGHYQAEHTGNIAGYSSILTFFPYDSVGIVLLTNQNGSPFLRLVPDFIADIFFHLPVRDKNSGLLARRKQYENRMKESLPVNADTISTKPSSVIAKYCGRFYNDGYGPLQTEPYKKAILLTYYNLKLVLLPLGGNRFSGRYFDDDVISADGVGNIEFDFDKQGRLQSVNIPLEPSVKDIVFRRQ